MGLAEDSYPVFASGPRTDLTIVYGSFVVSASGATLTASADTMKGLLITGAAGIYALAHPKCRFRSVEIKVLLPTIATVADKRDVVQHVGVAATDAAVDGVLNFNTQEEDQTTGVNAVLAPVDDSVIEVFGIMGF